MYAAVALVEPENPVLSVRAVVLSVENTSTIVPSKLICHPPFQTRLDGNGVVNVTAVELFVTDAVPVLFGPSPVKRASAREIVEMVMSAIVNPFSKTAGFHELA